MEKGIITIDIHGCNSFQAKTLIDSRLRSLPKSVYRLRIIHGYNLGTELQKMVRKAYSKHPRVLRIELGLNQGETDLVLRELFKNR